MLGVLFFFFYDYKFNSSFCFLFITGTNNEFDVGPQRPSFISSNRKHNSCRLGFTEDTDSAALGTSLFAKQAG